MEYVYAALMLHKLKKEITEENVTSIIKAAGAEVFEAQVKSLVASLADVNIEDAIKPLQLQSPLHQQQHQQKVEKAKKQKRKMKQQPASLKKQQWKVYHPYSAKLFTIIKSRSISIFNVIY